MGLISELRRRNVLRMVVLYAVAAWLIMQMAGVLIDLAKLPDWFGTTILWLLAVGFPIALIFSWFYELTPEGLSLEKDVDRSESITHVTGRRLDFIVISLLCAAVILFAYDKWWMSGPPEKSIAVLAFENMSGDPEQEYFSDGISEELLNLLAQIPGLRVPARTSSFQFKGKNVDVGEIAAALNVSHVLEGSVRKSGNKLRITAQLIKADDGFHVWSRSFDRELDDVFAVQEEIAAAISDVLKVKLALDATACVTASPEAHTAYLKGRYFLNKRTRDGLRNARRQFENAIQLDPDYALAYSGLADAFFLLSAYGYNLPADNWPKQRVAAFKALELDENCAEAHVSVGAVLTIHDWDWQGAAGELRRAIEINPNYALALQWYGSMLAIMGDPEHLPMMERAHAVDPVSLRVNVDLGLAYYFNEDYEKAIWQLRNTLDLDPNFLSINGALGLALIESGHFEEGIAEIEKGAGDSLSIWLGYAHAKAGNTEEALLFAEKWQDRWDENRSGAVPLALINVGLGRIDNAFEWLNKGIDLRTPAVSTLQSYSYWKPLRSDPRYEELLRRINLLD